MTEIMQGLTSVDLRAATRTRISRIRRPSGGVDQTASGRVERVDTKALTFLTEALSRSSADGLRW